MARIPGIRRGDLPPEQQRHYDYIAGNRPEVSGPFPLLLNSPDVAERIAHVGTYVRFETTLEPPVRELAILTVARTWDCQYEWTAHQPMAEKAGVRPDAIAAVRNRTAPDGLTEQETLVFQYVDALLRTHRIPDDTFARVLAWLGRQGTTDLTATAGYYSLLACTLNAFEVMPAAGTPPLLSDAEY